MSKTQAAVVRDRAPPTGGARLLDRILDAGILLSLIALIVVFSVLSPEFLTVNNLINIADASAVVGIVAVGMTVALIAGQFDLSVGSIVGFTSSLLALSMAEWGVPVGLAIPLAIAAAIDDRGDQRRPRGELRDQLDHRHARHAGGGARHRVRRREGQPDHGRQPVHHRRRRLASAGRSRSPST